MRIGFVFTNYNNSNYTKAAIHSILTNDLLNETHIVIVDNNSADDDIRQLKVIMKQYPQIIILFNKENVGYFKGLNIGIEYLKNQVTEIDCMVIGNNDLVFPKDFIDKIKDNKLIFEKFAVVSPDIITLEGIHQNPHVLHSVSKVREFIYDLYYSNYKIAQLILFIANKLKRVASRKDQKQFEKAQIISMGYGACYIIGSFFFKHFDKLWCPTFLMGEEFFLSRQLAEKQLQIYYEPQIKVEHHDHATLNQVPSKELWKISKQSHKVYRKFKPHF